MYALQMAIDPAWPETDGSLVRRADRIVGSAEAFMRAHREDKIDVDDIADHLHVSRRSLYVAFQIVRAYRPYTYLQRIRLESARVELCRSAVDDLSVTNVAERWRFGNLGRFDAAYRQRFGELPSETRRRRRSTREFAEPRA